MQTFDIQFKDNHPIIHSGGDIVLLDTGASHTIHQTETLEFCGEQYNCFTDYIGLTVGKLSNMVGTHITTLLGTDVMKGHQVLFDYRASTVQFSKQPIPFAGDTVPVTVFMGIPVVELTIEGKAVRCFLDTGAKLSFLPMEITKNYPNKGIEEDFHPFIGTFNTETHQIPATFQGKDLTFKCGNLPELLQLTLRMADVKGIIGYDFFHAFKVLLDLEAQEMSFAQYA